MPSKVRMIPKNELDDLHTGTLLRRRTELLRCEESFEKSDRVGYENIEHPGDTGFIEFKDQPEWAQAYQDVKTILSTREHLPTGAERKEKRQKGKGSYSRGKK